MTKTVTPTIRKNKIPIAGTVVLLSSVVYYLAFRTQLPWPGYLFDTSWAYTHGLSDFSLGSYPSFAFTLAMGFFSIALFRHNSSRCVSAIGCIWLVGAVHECSLGTFDKLDMLAGTAGALTSLATLKLLSPHKALNSAATTGEFQKFWALILVSGIFATGTSAYDPINNSCYRYDTQNNCIEQYQYADPIYMSYDALRSSVNVTAPQDLTSVARIYIYNSYLFMNELNKGIHIIDNRFPATPQRIGFIEIPGNTEISIKDDNLYADSYIDLVTIDLTDMGNIVEIAREQDIFPYDARQNVPNNILFNSTIDATRGVVVGHR